MGPESLLKYPHDRVANAVGDCYEDHLRQHGLPQWAKDDRNAQAVREVGRRHHDSSDPSDPTDPTDPSENSPYAAWLNHSNSAVVANALICLIHQANYLLDQQIAALERQFISEGGYSERLAAARMEHRRTQPESQGLTCPLCKKPMALRTARQGQNAGSQFWGCSGYPTCKGTRKLDGSDRSVRSDGKES